LSGSLARRYVQPLFEVAQEKGELERIASDLAALDQALHESAELKEFLANPSIQRKVKWILIEKVFAEASLFTLNFMRVVIDKNRPEVLGATYRLFTDMLNIHRGIAPGVVETAVPLDDAAFDNVKRTLETRFGCKLELERKIERNLLGGMRVRIGNNVIDGSVRGKLEDLKSALSGG